MCKECEQLKGEVERLRAERAEHVSPCEAQELQSVLNTVVASGRAFVTSARELRALWEKTREERDTLRAKVAEREAGWVSVEERLPENADPVLVFIPGNLRQNYYVDSWRMQQEYPLATSSASIETGYMWDEHDFDEVSHWRPLPPAPEGARSAPETQHSEANADLNPVGNKGNDL